MTGAGRGAASRSAAQQGRARAGTDPFAVLGLDAGAQVSDDDVRAAWRRIATATHPDRADGGDPGRFAGAAAAYTELRTRSGRGEARAGLAEDRGPPAGQASRRGGVTARAAGLTGLLAGGRPARLACRVLAAGAAAAAAVLAAGPGPAGPALATGALTWLVLTARRDLGPRARRQPAAGQAWPAAAPQPGSRPVATGRDGSDDHADHEPT